MAKSWIESYLDNRQQYVEVADAQSIHWSVEWWVPQGSMLGPKLMYVNDITNTLDILKSLLFADDTTILCLNANIVDLIKTVNNELDALYDWFCANKLSLNVAKTYYDL